MIGAAGAGKSFLCAILAGICERLWGGGWAVLSMDGYHFPNAYLEATTYTDPSTGAVHSLKAMKGQTPLAMTITGILTSQSMNR